MSQLVGTLIKTLVVKPYHAKSITEVLELGDYHGVFGDIINSFTEVSLDEVVGVDLFQYNRSWSYQEVVTWAKENDDKKPILPKHLFGIGIQHPNEQNWTPIVSIGSVRGALYLHGNLGFRYLQYLPYQYMVADKWAPSRLVGFLSN